MKRSLLMSLLVVAAVAMTTGTAMAVVDLQLNLRYTDPANEAAGGSWDLLVQTDDADGVVGLSVGLDDVNSTFTNNNATLGWNIAETQVLGTGVVEIVLGYDLAGALPAGIGTSTGPGNVALDDHKNPAWNNSALLASGTFGAARPSFAFAEANEIEAGAAVAATIGVTSVRGDGVASDGLIPGDANRDGVVNATDFSILASPNNFNQAGGWDRGDFNSSGTVNATDFSILASPTNFGQTRVPPALAANVAAVPEPTSMVLAAFALIGLAGRRR